MKREIAIIAAAAFLTGCCAYRHAGQSTDSRDSTRVEIRYREVIVPDTVTVAVPVETVRERVMEDSSHLETSLAVSDARINHDGSLSHSLANKAGRREVVVQTKIEYRDSIEWRDREVVTERTVEVERALTGWQKFRLRMFWVFLALSVGLLFKGKIAALVKKIK